MMSVHRVIKLQIFMNSPAIITAANTAAVSVRVMKADLLIATGLIFCVSK